jgi:hypothetical protein
MNKQDFDHIVSCLLQAKDKSGLPLAMKNIMASTPSQIFSYDFDPEQGLTDLRSISKVPLCMAVGVAISMGIKVWGEPLSADTYIFPLLDKYSKSIEKKHLSLLKKVKLRHLLSNTSGHEQGFLFRKDIGNRDMNKLLEYISEIPIKHEPGTHFSYSNVGPYLVSAIIQDEIGISLLDLVAETIFSPLNIKHYEWKKYGNYVAGCSGLMLEKQDLHKLGQLLLNNGVWNGGQVVPPTWIELMRSPLVRSPEKYEPHRALPKFSYGFSLWVTEKGNYYCDGTDGQYLIIVPSRQLVISTTGSQPDMKPITECMRTIL